MNNRTKLKVLLGGILKEDDRIIMIGASPPGTDTEYFVMHVEVVHFNSVRYNNYPDVTDIEVPEWYEIKVRMKGPKHVQTKAPPVKGVVCD